MENNSFLQTYHPANKLLTTTLHLRNFNHYNFPGLNVATEDLIADDVPPDTASETYQPPLLNIGRPIPCLSPKYVEEQDNPREDQIMQLVRKKYFWKKRKKQMEVVVNRLTSRPVLFPKLVRAVKKNEDVNKLPYGVVRLADHLANNPDKYFKGLYHWYYGNALKKFSIKEDQFLLYPSGKNLNELCMTLFEKPKSSEIVPQLIPQVSMSMPTSGFIYDIATNECTQTIGVRQRDACSFINYYEDHDGSISFKNFLSVKSAEYPFVAMDNCDTEFCTVNAKRSVQFWTPEYLTHCVEHTTLPEPEFKLHDKFVQVKYDSNHSSQIFVVVDRQNVYFYDKRESYVEPCSHLRPDKQTEECEEISLLVPSVKEKTWYLGMNHSCLLLDTRMGFAEKWTHMMTQTPSVGHAFQINKSSHVLKEAVILSAQTINDAVALYHNENEERVTYTPARLPSRRDTLHEAHINGVLTNLHLQNKFNYSIIGLAAYKMKKRMGILSLVSTGDIFHQRVSTTRGDFGFDKNSTSLSEEELDYLENWEREFHSVNVNQEKSLTFTRSVDFSELVNSVNESVEVPTWKSSAPPKKAHWKLSIKELREYKDLLAPHILHEYGVDDFESSSDECENDPLAENVERVENWLSGNSGELNDDMMQEENDTGDMMFAISNFHEDDARVLDPIIELNVEVPPSFDLEHLSKKPKRRRRR